VQGSFDRCPDTRLLAAYPQVALRCGTQHQHPQLLRLRLPQLPQHDADLFFGNGQAALDLLTLGRGSALGLLLLTLTCSLGCLLLSLLCLGQLDLQVCSIRTRAWGGRDYERGGAVLPRMTSWAGTTTPSTIRDASPYSRRSSPSWPSRAAAWLLS
jgi:hypothetical protein